MRKIFLFFDRISAIFLNQDFYYGKTGTYVANYYLPSGQLWPEGWTYGQTNRQMDTHTDGWMDGLKLSPGMEVCGEKFGQTFHSIQGYRDRFTGDEIRRNGKKFYTIY